MSNLPAPTLDQVNLERTIELFAALPAPPSYGEEGKEARYLSMLDRINDIDPRDATESMLATQIVSTQAVVMEKFRKAAEAGMNNPHLEKMYLSQAERFSALYLRQMQVLDKHRQRGRQNITVRHVQVDSGGQAIVGNVEVKSGGMHGPQA